MSDQASSPSSARPRNAASRGSTASSAGADAGRARPRGCRRDRHHAPVPAVVRAARPGLRAAGRRARSPCSPATVNSGARPDGEPGTTRTRALPEAWTSARGGSRSGRAETQITGPVRARERRKCGRAAQRHEREPRVGGGPAAQAGVDRDGPPLAGQQQRAAAALGQVDGQRRRGAHRRVAVVGVGRAREVDDDERPRVAARPQVALVQLAGPRVDLPGDARRRGTGPVHAQPVEIDLGSRGGKTVADGRPPPTPRCGVDAFDARQDQHLVSRPGLP